MNSMPNIPSTGTTISVTVIPREEVYYYITDREMRNIKHKNLSVDLFTLLFSLFMGAFITVIVTKSAAINLPVETIAVLNIYQWFSLVVGIIFLSLVICFYVIRNRDIEELKKSPPR